MIQGEDQRGGECIESASDFISRTFRNLDAYTRTSEHIYSVQSMERDLTNAPNDPTAEEIFAQVLANNGVAQVSLEFLKGTTEARRRGENFMSQCASKAVEDEAKATVGVAEVLKKAIRAESDVAFATMRRSWRIKAAADNSYGATDWVMAVSYVKRPQEEKKNEEAVQAE